MQRWRPSICALYGLQLCAALAYAADTHTAGGDFPEKFIIKTDAWDYTKREVMIPMRDGVKLKTFILIPKDASHAPILLTRTPYDSASRVLHFNSSHLAAAVPQMDDTAVAAGYIIAFQDVRGKYGSQGDYVMTRPLRGPLNATAVDHATDTYDTIDWLIKNVPQSNGRVGTLGGSYEGYTAVMSTVRPHPALKVAVPFAPMVDGWMGDDWFHYGAFRQDASLSYIYEQDGSRAGDYKWWSDSRDTYEAYLRAGSAGAMAASRGLEQTGFWRAVAAHPAYDAFWQQQAVDKLLAALPLQVPMLIVSGWFDQEDIYGGPALFRALAPKDPDGAWIHLVLGPWNHGQGRREGRAIGPIQFEGDTATDFRRAVMQPFLDYYLKDGPKPDTPRVLAYETGVNTEPLKGPLRIAGQPIADLYASTSGTDSDWVVKLIDVWPDEVPEHPALGGYQQMLSADIFRGRYREDFAVAHPLAANTALPYRIALPNASHTFLPGHRLMVQIQSSWFPLYDRNPQNFVPNIMYAAPSDFTRATQRVWHTAGAWSAIELPVIGPPIADGKL